MRLQLNTYRVRDAAFGQRTALANGVLEIDRAELLALLRRDPNFRSVSLDLARPGESTRIVHILDSVEPRVKVDGPGTIFPGFLGGAEVVGQGATNRITGCTVVETSNLSGAEGSQGIKEAILDMSGPGAEYTPLGRTVNLVLGFEVDDAVTMVDAVASIRLAGLRAAAYLAEATRGLPPDEREVFELGPADPALPKVAYISPAMREGEVHATYFYAEAIPSLPLYVHPNEELDGAIVSADYWIASHRVPTYYFQNNPVTRELYRLHGRELDFLGIILCRSLVPTELGKRRQAAQVAKLAARFGAAGAIITMSNGGNAYIDQMLIGQACEQAGIKSVLCVDEYGDSDGRGNPLVISVPEAVAMVSVGNQDEPVTLPPMERVLGGESFLGGNLYERAFQERRPVDEITVGLRQVYCATNQLGMSALRALAY